MYIMVVLRPPAPLGPGLYFDAPMMEIIRNSNKKGGKSKINDDVSSGLPVILCWVKQTQSLVFNNDQCTFKI
jgi:hypothetical protein